MRWRRILIRVFLLARDALFISAYYRAPLISKAHKHIYKGGKFCIWQTIITRKKTQRSKDTKNLALGLGGFQIRETRKRKRILSL
jgi:hypothetical protein